MTIHSGHVTVRVTPDDITNISTNNADIELTDHEVLDLIDALAAVGHAEYMQSSSRCALLEAEDEARNTMTNTFTEPVNTPGDNNIQRN